MKGYVFSLLVAILLPFRASAALMNFGPSLADGRGPASQSNSVGNLSVESLGEIKNGIISIGAKTYQQLLSCRNRLEQFSLR